MRVGAVRDRIASDRIRVLHDRRIPGSKANIDHLVVSPAGIWVIDAKKYTGRPQLLVEGGLFRPRVEKLIVGRRDQTKLVEGVLRQVERVSAIAASVPVHGALCFVDADWPLLGGAFRIRGIEALWPRKLAALVSGASDVGVDVPAVARLLAERFRPM